ncbi:unnamed protein product [Musa hybrid cultivar]
MGSSEDEWELLQRERVDADAAAAPPPTTCKEMRIKEENNQSAGQPRHRLAVSARWESRPIAFALLRWVAPSVSFAGYRGPHFGRQVNAGRARGLLAYKKTGAWPPVGRSVDAAGVTSAGWGGGERLSEGGPVSARGLSRGTRRHRPIVAGSPSAGPVSAGRRWQTCLCSPSQSCEQ